MHIPLRDEFCGAVFIQGFKIGLIMECQGECKKHDECKGEVRPVMVYGSFCPTGMQFTYCQEAREEDERRGFGVYEIDEHGLTALDYDDGIAYPNG